MIEKVEMWRASDGQEYESEQEAEGADVKYLLMKEIRKYGERLGIEAVEKLRQDRVITELLVRYRVLFPLKVKAPARKKKAVPPGMSDDDVSCPGGQED